LPQQAHPATVPHRVPSMRDNLFNAVLEKRLVWLTIGDSQVLLQPLALYVTDDGTESLCGIALDAVGDRHLDLALADISTATVTNVISHPELHALILPRPGQRRIIVAMPSFMVGNSNP
jgi:hypothetical protein